MLQLNQIKPLLDEGLFIYKGHPGCVDYRVVFADARGATAPGEYDLTYAHPADETQEEWRDVDTPDFKPEDYKLHYSGHEYGGHFTKVGCWEFEQPVVTKVVKFLNPRPQRPGYHHKDHFVVIESTEPLTDEDACERAIEVVLGLGAGFDGTNAHPALVI